MTIQVGPTSPPPTPMSQIRWLKIRNVEPAGSNRIIPPFGVCELQYFSQPTDPINQRRPYGLNTEEIDGFIIFRVCRPRYTAGGTASTGMYLFNGVMPLKPSGDGYLQPGMPIGHATQDFPARVFCKDFTEQSATVSTVPGSWAVKAASYGWTCLGPCLTLPLGLDSEGHARVIWIAPRDFPAWLPVDEQSLVLTGLSVADPGEEIPLATDPAAGTLQQGIERDGNGLRVSAAGVYQVTASMMLWASAAAGDYLLTVRLQKNGSATPFLVRRLHLMTYTTKESVTLIASIQLAAGDRLSLVNESDIEITADNLIFSAYRLGF